TDMDTVSDWAAEEVAAIAGMGIINGYPDNSFRPAESATRAECATIISNYYLADENRPDTQDDINGEEAA
ncbi:MAG: S-layer homology domain-containing protein, partial [Sporomusa sp.]